MTSNIQARRTYLARRLLILTAYETAELPSLCALAEACAQYHSVHLYVFNPSRSVPAHEYDGRFYMHRLCGDTAIAIGAIAAYYTLHGRLRALGTSLLPLPPQAHGLWGWFWHRRIAAIFYHRCLSLSIPPYAIVATDPITLEVALKVKPLYRCQVILLSDDSSLKPNGSDYQIMNADALQAYAATASIAVSEIRS